MEGFEETFEMLSADDYSKEIAPAAPGEQSPPEQPKEETKETLGDGDFTPVFDFPATGDDKEEPQESVAKGGQAGEEVKDTGKDPSPTPYSSIALALQKDGLLTLDDSDIAGVEDASDLAALFQKQVDKLLEDRQKRVADALDYGVEPSRISSFEQTLNYLDSITDEAISDEGEEAQQLRGNIIFQDFINRGFSKERANKEVKKSFDAGSDIEDAREALEENKNFFKGQYDNLISEAKKQKEQYVQAQKEASKKLEKRFLDTAEPIPGVKLSEIERKKLLNSWKNFVSKDEQGRPMTALQKYARENVEDYQYNINLLYYLTDGFKDMGKVLDKKVKEKTKTALSDLEKTLNNPSNRVGFGGIDFGNSQDERSRYVVYDPD
jgi:hypothetical protein